ncbi:disulfide bond formation protein B [Candidatus Pelagibacter sp.]|jgi:disulfide bond formation protein DsbB|nr:disulfide bond formation protein B [Candidatus Pelagibacter sp.]
MPKFKIEFYLNLIFLLSLLAIITAYFIQYVLGYQPCNLCIIERIPYALSLFILTINFIFKKNEKVFVLLLIFIFIFSLMISIYHLGIEQGFFKESFICNLQSGADIVSKEELLKELQKKIVSCKDVTFKIFGFSLTSINIVSNLFIIILLTKIFITYEKFKKKDR